MLKKIFVPVLLVMAMTVCAQAQVKKMQGAVSLGYALTMSGLTDLDNSITLMGGTSASSSSGGIYMGAEFLVDPGWHKNLLVGGEISYASVYNYEWSYSLGLSSALASLAGLTSTTYKVEASFSVIPVLAVARYTLVDKLFGTAGLGYAIGSATWKTTPTITTASSVTAGSSLAAMIGAGYTLNVAKQFDIEPRAKLYMFFTGGTFMSFVPQVSGVYHF